VIWLVGILIWVILSLSVALLVGGSIRLAEKKERGSRDQKLARLLG